MTWSWCTTALAHKTFPPTGTWLSNQTVTYHHVASSPTRTVVHVHNPGRLPIDNVRVDWHFSCTVRRRRSGVLEPATKLLQLTTPVLPGGGERRWERRLVMDYAEGEAALPETYAQVHFVDVEGRSRTTRWPRISV
jgi:hypothetical protein